MKRSHNFRRLVLALAAVCPALSWAACVADGPLATVRWIFEKQYYFYAQPGEQMTEAASAELLRLLNINWRCAQGGKVCAVEVDPWTNARVGSVLDPIVFSLRTSPPERTRVAMRYLLGSANEGAAEPQPVTAELVLIRDAATQCWRLDDLVGAGGISLRTTLEQYRFDLK